MSVRSVDQQALWDVEETEYGDPMVFHTHPAGKVPAYVVSRWEGGTLAQCSACMAYMELEERDERAGREPG